MMTIGLPTEPQKPRTPFDEWAEPYRAGDAPGWLFIPGAIVGWVAEADARRIYYAARADVLVEAADAGIGLRYRDGAMHLDV